MTEYVILDTETTGKGDSFPFDQICQIAVSDADGNPLHYELVRPTISIPDEATDIHGINNAAVAEARSFGDVLPDVIRAIDGRPVWIYNAGFDMRLMLFSAVANDLMLPEINAKCAMLEYAEAFGQEGHDGAKWHKLGAAFEQQMGRTFIYGHDALEDCRMTAAILKRLGDPSFKTVYKEPFPVYLTSVEVRVTAKGDTYASFLTSGEQRVNVFLRKYSMFEAAKIPLASMITTLSDVRPKGYVHTLISPILAEIAYREYPEVVSVGK